MGSAKVENRSRQTDVKTDANRVAGQKGTSMPAVPVLQNYQFVPPPHIDLQAPVQLQTPVSPLKAFNNTGLPDQLRSGIERSSGFDLSDVRVHYNSPKPTQLQAFAYAQGADIHVAPGQEKHLPHEAWHVVQQKQGRVQPTMQLNNHTAVNDDVVLEKEADTAGSKALRIDKMAADESSAPGTIQKKASGYGNVVQRIIPELTDITSDLIPPEWVAAYIADVANSRSHLYDEDIINYLNTVAPNWHADVALKNTGGNHWDVRITKPDGEQINVETRPDGNCGIHAIQAVLNRAVFNRNTVYAAPGGKITEVRTAISTAIAADEPEIKTRILLEIQRNPIVELTGFGPQLQELLKARVIAKRAEHEVPDVAEEEPVGERSPSGEVSGSAPSASGLLSIPTVNTRKYQRFARLLKEGVPKGKVREIMLRAKLGEEETTRFLDGYDAAPAELDEGAKPDKVELMRKRVLALEEELMDMVDLEVNENQFLKDIKRLLLARAKTLTDEAAEGWEAKVEELRTKFAAYKKRSEKTLARNSEGLRNIGAKRKEWMTLMEELCGTHIVLKSGGTTGSHGLVKRHDAKPGGYGRTPTAEDAQISHRRVEVLHGHGGWQRTGLLSTGILDDNMPGLTSLGEIVERANVIRRSKKLLDLPIDKVDLAFVDHHGSTIDMGKVITGAYPDLMPLPIKLHKQVIDMLEAAKKAEQDPDDYFNARCTKKVTDAGKAKYAKKKGIPYKPDITVTNPVLLEAYNRVKAGTAGGKAAKFVDIIDAATRGDVKFPDSRIGHLMGVDAGEKKMRAESEGILNYNMSTVDNLKSTQWDSASLHLSDAIVERLSNIRVIDEPVRIIWAACRSEQFSKEFSDPQFLNWIKNAAEARKASAEGS